MAKQTLETEQTIQNMSYDPEFEVLQAEVLGHDSVNNVLRRIQVDSSGNIKVAI